MSRRTKPVDMNIVRSKDFENRFGFIQNPIVRNTVCDTCRKILQHRSGSTLEDLYFVSVKSGAVVSKNVSSLVSKRVFLNRDNIAAINRASKGELITIHNHPESMPPSFLDYVNLSLRSFRYGIIICHNTEVIRYRIVDAEIFKTVLLNNRGNELDEFAKATILAFRTQEGDAIIRTTIEKSFGVSYERFY